MFAQLWVPLNTLFQNVQSLYMHEGVAPMVESTKTPCNACIDLEEVSKELKKMANGKLIDVTL